jgi:MYXO-CTERM domain-containing protein
MKKLALVAAVVALVTVVPAHATIAPEPSSFVQLAAGLIVLGGLALVARKRVSSTDAA